VNVESITKNFFSSELSKFKLKNGLTLALCYYLIVSTVVFYQWILLKINVTYFESIYSKQFPGFPEAFYDFLVGESSILLMLVGSIGIVIFFVGGMVSELLLLPFKYLAKFTDESLKNPNLEYEPKNIINFQFLSRFSEFFFGQIGRSRVKKVSMENGFIPKSFTRIHAPPFDGFFLLQFSLVMLLILGISSYMIILFNSTLYSSVIDFVMSNDSLKGSNAIDFIIKQQSIFEEVIYPLMFLSLVGNLFISAYMYSRVSGAAFGIFSTFRAFFKGNRKARIHLIGYTFVREHTRKLNSYLEQMEIELEQIESSSPKGPLKIS
jgi:hypothetical protein